ncbi:MAG: zf-HC2 domain-containing protein [Eubacteriales bacterium]|nr:zf-HC2 domain-containing protein [Eubacteriales bacterium]
MMNCRAAEGMVMRYINHTLSIEEMEEFLEHVQSCCSCYDELETYFIVHEAIVQLDEDEGDAVLDLQHLLEQDLKKSRRYIRKKKAVRFFLAAAFVVLIAALIALFVFVVMELAQFL